MPRQMHAHSVMLKPELSSVSKSGLPHKGGAVMHLIQVSKSEKQVVTSKKNMWERFFFPCRGITHSTGGEMITLFSEEKICFWVITVNLTRH